MKNIVAIQHPQSEHHTNGMVGSWTDWALTPLGVRQAETLAERLAAEIGGRPWAIYSSDLARARQTAEIVGARLGAAPRLTGALRERNLGRAVGQSVQWLRAHMERPMSTVDDRMFSDGESTRDVWNRLTPFLHEIMESPQEDVLIVSHGDTLGVFCALWTGVPLEMLNRFALHGPAGGVAFLREEPDGRRLIRRFGDTSFLSGPA